MTAYYNEHDPKKAAWLRELIADGIIAPGIVDERSIEDVLPSELVQYTQCHFFAGIGIWSYALRQAGWPDDRPVWTGSCPCQPFSAAGKRAGLADERHLWPAFYWLIRQCQPDVVFGEQVASKDGIDWLDIVWADLEAANYAIGPLDLCAAGVGAPHIRQRLYFVAESLSQQEQSTAAGRLHAESSSGGPANQLGDAEVSNGRVPVRQWRSEQDNPELGRTVTIDILGDTDAAGSQGRRLFATTGEWPSSDIARSSPTNGFWRDAEWIYCRDGKWRPTQPGLSPLVNGAAERLVRSSNPSAPLDADNTAEARTLRLQGYGDGIVAPLAVEFIKAAMEWNA